MLNQEVIIIGAGAAGLMCAIEAGKRGRAVLVIDHANKPGKKILMSGGGRCNFTNNVIAFDNYISHNSHFCKSALSRYTQWDFINLVQQYNIPYHEKTLGQLFCDNKSKDILNMLLAECERYGVHIKLNTTIDNIQKLSDHNYMLYAADKKYRCESLVIATGGLSIPTMGASAFGYNVAKQFGLTVWPTRAGLVPFVLGGAEKEKFTPLSGVSVNVEVMSSRKTFAENMLFTHRGLSGPAILQISSYWKPGEDIEINLVPKDDLFEALVLAQQHRPQITVQTFLSHYIPKRVVMILLDPVLAKQSLKTLFHKQFEHIANAFQQWTIKPCGTEGYRTAEVTLGGVDCNGISSKTMEANDVPGLYFIGEVLDVTGWLGGYNFQWAWSSGWVAGQVV